MNSLKIYTTEDASPASSELLKSIDEQYGFIPNVFGVIAESAPALKAFAELNRQFSSSSFDPTSRELIQLVTSIENQCTYCIAGHTAFADMQHVPDEIISAVLNKEPLKNEKLEVLRNFTRLLVRHKGSVPEKVIKDFLQADYSYEQIFEVILGICVKTFSNLASNTMAIPLDKAFEKYSSNHIPQNLAL